MRRMLLGLAIGLGTSCPAGAGVYNLNPPRSIYPSDFVQATARNPSAALVYLGEIRASNDQAPKANHPEPGSLRAAYLRQAAELGSKQKDGSLSPEDRVNLGACLIRLGRSQQAMAVLEEAQRAVPADSPCRPFLLANLASAYQDNDDLLQRAIDTQNQAIKGWPQQWPGWKPGEGLWYRRAECYALELMLLRQAERRNPAGRAGENQTLYPLFPRVRFVGPHGRYEAGRMDFAMWNKLPFDAESIVLQLLFWRPLDDRLYWHYGELLNARGQVDFASRILEDLFVNRQQRQPELQEHYRILKAAKQSPEELKGPLAQDWGLWVGGPREQAMSPPPPSNAGSTATGSGNWLPDWRTVTVSFAAGLIVALLGVLQWQQWRRRRQVAVLTRQGEENAYG